MNLKSVRMKKRGKQCFSKLRLEHQAAYISWYSMKSRCDNTATEKYLKYGGRGITYDPRWSEFKNFLADMGDPPKDNITQERLSLDRKDNNGNYNKENCRWATRSQQSSNRNDFYRRTI